MARTLRPAKAKKKMEHLPVRVSYDVRNALETTAKRAGHNLSDEIRIRLERTLEADQAIERQLGTPHVAALALLLARLVQSIEDFTGETWRNSPYTVAAVAAGEHLLLEQLGPKRTDEPLKIPKGIMQTWGDAQSAEWVKDRAQRWRDPRDLGESIALGILDQLRMLKTAIPRPLREGLTEVTNTFDLMPIVNRMLDDTEKL